MSKYKYLLTSTMILFLLVNTGYYWEGNLGGWNMLVLLLYVISFLILGICLIYYLYLSVREKFKDKARLYVIMIVGLLLVAVIAKPTGLIDFERFESKDLFIGGQEGVANCTVTLKLKENKKFYFRYICFGIGKDLGYYTVKKDTIKFKFSNEATVDRLYEFGIYKQFAKPYDKKIGEILLYTSKKANPYPLIVYKNELIK